MKKEKKRTEPSALPESLNKRIAVYALAATAAGVGALALAPPAQASIIVDTTPFSIKVASFSSLKINGKAVLSFEDSFFPGTSSAFGKLVAEAGIESGKGLLPSPLAEGASIGPDQHFLISTLMATNHSSHGPQHKVGGPWANKTGYLGFEFKCQSGSGTGICFGWANLKVTASTKGETGLISSFAYDTVAGQTIDAGQTSSATVAEPGEATLMLLGLGVLGLAEFRRRRVAQRS